MLILSAPISDSKAKIVGAYLDNTQVTVVVAQTLPMAPAVAGKDSVLYINPQTKEMSYEYEDRPLTEAEKYAQSEQEQAAMLLALVMGGLM